MKNSSVILKSFNNELEKIAVSFGAGKALGIAGAGVIGGAAKAAKGLWGAPLNIARGAKTGFTRAIKSSTPEARAAFQQRLNTADNPLLKSKGGETIWGKSGPKHQTGAQGHFNIGGQEVGTKEYMQQRVARKQRLYNYMQSRTPAAKAKRVGKVVGGGLGATAAIGAGGTVYGGLTMEPSIAASYSGESPAVGPVYGGRYY